MVHVAGESAASTIVGAESASDRDVRPPEPGSGLADRLVDEHQRRGAAQADSRFGDRDGDREKTVGLVEEPANIEPAVLAPEIRRWRRVGVSGRVGEPRRFLGHECRS